MSVPESSSSRCSDAIAAAAAAWLARRDRGFSAAEQDAFLQWLRADPRHRAALGHLDRAWIALDSLAEWQPADGAEPNPDLLAPGRAHRPRRGLQAFTLACGCAAIVLGVVAWRNRSATVDVRAPTPGMRVIPGPERRALADGSVAEVKHGGRFEVEFVADERRVRLREGKVHFIVAQNTAWPFVVHAGDIVVRAVGTAFTVDREGGSIQVLVTEGRVQIESATAAHVPVSRGERARIEPGRRPVVTAERPETIARELSWREVRLEFEGLPLATVVGEFNLRNVRQLVIGDDAAGKVQVAGTFLAREPEAFAQLLEVSFGIAVNRHDEGAWVLHSVPAPPAK